MYYCTLQQISVHQEVCKMRKAQFLHKTANGKPRKQFLTSKDICQTLPSQEGAGNKIMTSKVVSYSYS